MSHPFVNTRETAPQPSLRAGVRARARFEDSTVEGEVLEVRSAGERTRIVLAIDEETELDTDARRVTPIGIPCSRCQATVARSHMYRCPECGADLVD